MELKTVNMLDLPNILSKSVKWIPVPVNEAFENGLMSLDYLRKISKVGLMPKVPQLLFKQNDERMDMKVKSVLDEAIEYYTLTNRGKGTDELLKEIIDRLYN